MFFHDTPGASPVSSRPHCTGHKQSSGGYRLYGYKTADGPDLFTTYHVRGFVRARSVVEAARHFGVRADELNGYTIIAPVTPEEHRRGLAEMEKDREAGGHQARLNERARSMWSHDRL